MSGTTRAELAAVAGALRARVDALEPHERAWAALWHSDAARPWTDAAVSAFAALPDDPDGRVAHHLAVLHHARAWDAEDDGRPADAVADWAAALGHWVRVHRCDAFWDAAADEVGTALGPRADGAAAAAAARRCLPGQLLDLHVDLALEHAERGRAALGAEHLRLVRESGFDAAEVARARQRLAAGWSDRVHDALERVRFNEVFYALDERAGLDPGNPWLVELLLYVTDRWTRYLIGEGGLWQGKVRALLDRAGPRIAELADDADPADIPGTLDTQLGRHESWLAYLGLLDAGPDVHSPDRSLPVREDELRAVIGHARRALELDPSLRTHDYYVVGKDLAAALTRLARVRRRRGATRDEVLGLLDEALELEEDPARRSLRDTVADTVHTVTIPGPADPGPADPGPADPGSADPGLAEPDLDPGRADSAGADPVRAGPGPGVDELAGQVRRYVLAQDGPRAVEALEAMERLGAGPDRVRGMLPALRALVRGTEWEGRLE